MCDCCLATSKWLPIVCVDILGTTFGLYCGCPMACCCWPLNALFLPNICILRLSRIWPSIGIFACLLLLTQSYYWCMKSNICKMALIQQKNTPNCTELLSLHWHLLDLLSLKPRHRWCTGVCVTISEVCWRLAKSYEGN